MKEYEVKMVLDLTNPEGANFHNSIRSLDGIKNAISSFKGYLTDKLDNVVSQKPEKGSPNEMLKNRLEEIISVFEQSFKDNGITI